MIQRLEIYKMDKNESDESNDLLLRTSALKEQINRQVEYLKSILLELKNDEDKEDDTKIGDLEG